MPRPSRPNFASPPLKIAAIYLALAGVWIVFSDQLLALFIADARLLTLAQTLKGWLFVGATAVVLYGLLRRELASYQATTDNLRRSGQELRDLLDAMPVGVALTDGTTIEYINVNFTERFGYTLDEIPTDAQWFLLAYPDPSYREPLINAWQSALRKARESGAAIKPFEVRIQCKNGDLCQAIANTQLLGSRIVIIFTDITERERLRHELVKMQKLESIGLLAGGMAHDFNNILTGITANLSFAQVLLDAQHPAVRPLRAAEQAAGRAAELTGQLLTFARGGEPVREVMALAGMISRALHLLHGTQVQAELAIAEDLRCVEADSGQLTQVLTNLIVNAIQAMPDGGQLRLSADNLPTGTVHPALPAGNYVRIQLHDNGPGMTPQVLERIFEPYFTTKADNSGLGLATAYSIISRHGGSLIAESTPGQGSLFTILLPATDAVAPAEQATATTAPAAVSWPPRILVMDDEAAIRDIAAAMLGYLGCEVETCDDGAEAVRRYRLARVDDRPFAAVLMDLTIPGGMGGREAAQQILSTDPQASLIVSSGYSHDPVLADYTLHGFQGVLPKPYKVADLQQVLASVLPPRA